MSTGADVERPERASRRTTGLAAPRRRSDPSTTSSRATSAAGRCVVGGSRSSSFFGFTASNFFTAVNFINIIVQMAGVTMLAYGVVFVLLLGEIDLSIGYRQRRRGRRRGRAPARRSARTTIPGMHRDRPRDPGHCAAIGLFQGSIVAQIGVPAFVVTLAGLLIWQGVIQTRSSSRGVIVIQDNTVNDVADYFFSDTWAGSSHRRHRRC